MEKVKSKINRFISEFFQPAKKCERLGHTEKTIHREGFVKAEFRWHVADSVKQTRQICSRCNEPLSDWKTTSRQGLHGLTMPSEAFDELRETGFTTGF